VKAYSFKYNSDEIFESLSTFWYARTSEGAAIFVQVVLVPDVLFLIFLAINARRSYDILIRNPSMTMWTYYILVWAVCIINFVHTALQMGGHTRDGSEYTHLWNLLWLMTRFVMMMLEVRTRGRLPSATGTGFIGADAYAFLCRFLLHGYIGSAIVMLKRTAVISFAIALFDATLKAILIWGFKVPLYSFGGAHVGDVQGDMLWSKWGFWMAHALIFASAYLAMLVLPFTKWRDLLPSKDTFHYYVRILFTVNVVRYSSSFTPAMAELEVSCAVPGH
jgi:hypothetical protein